jgi:hypothetical protein
MLEDVELETYESVTMWRAPGKRWVHLYGPRAFTRVTGSNWNSAARSIGIDLARCGNGQYSKEVEDAKN